MKIILSRKMFDLMGLDSFVANEFYKQQKIFMKQNSSKIKNNTIYDLGHVNISKYLENIFYKHGQPKNTNFPTDIYFRLYVSKKLSQFFSASVQLGKDKYLLTVFSNNPSIILKPGNISETIGHELQHVISFIYQPGLQSGYSIKQLMESKEHNILFSDPTEIQAYCYETANLIMQNIQISYDIQQDFKHKNKQELCQHFSNNYMQKIRDLVVGHCNMFFIGRLKQTGYEFPQELKTQYYKSTLRNTIDKYQEWLNRICE